MKSLKTCPICGSDRIEFDFAGPTTRQPNDGKRWSVDHCLNCNHRYMNPQLEWNELSEYYPSSYEPYNPAADGDESDDAIIERTYETGSYRHVRISPGIRLLDVGCGGGSFLRIARRLGAIGMGVEPSEFGASQTRRQGIDVFHGTLDRFVETCGPDVRFDLITSSHVLEHAPDPVPMLEYMGRLLAPGGMIWVAVPNAACFFARSLKARWHSTDVPLHLMQFSPESLVEAIRLAGLQLKRIYTYSLPTAVASSIRLYLRHSFLIPIRFTSQLRWIDGQVAPRLGVRLDKRSAGEAIIAECARLTPGSELSK